MIFNNLKPRLDEAMKAAKVTGEGKEVKLIYNEIDYPSAMNEAFEYLFTHGQDFETRHDEYRFVLIIKPKN